MISIGGRFTPFALPMRRIVGEIAVNAWVRRGFHLQDEDRRYWPTGPRCRATLAGAHEKKRGTSPRLRHCVG